MTDVVEVTGVMGVEGEQLTSLFGASLLPSSSCFSSASSCSIYLKKVILLKMVKWASKGQSTLHRQTQTNADSRHVSDIPRPNKYRFSMFNSVCQHLSVQCELELFLESGKALIFKYLALSASAREILFCLSLNLSSCSSTLCSYAGKNI